MTGKDHGWTRPYLNYMLCMAALSQHVDKPPTSVLELGGGFGVLGEFLLARGPQMRYVDLDIPPLLTVASYYLRTLYGSGSPPSRTCPPAVRCPSRAARCSPTGASPTCRDPSTCS